MSKTKLAFLDGIRGLMAISVILHHFIQVFYPQLAFYAKAVEIGGPFAWLSTSPLSVFINGNTPVQYFFVLTGFLVCRSVILGRELKLFDLAEKCVNRYLRLLPIVAAAISFSCICMLLKLQYHLIIGEETMNPLLLDGLCNFTPQLKYFLKDIFYTSYLSGSTYVSPFWAVPYEFWGYIISLFVCRLLKGKRFRRLGYVAVAILLNRFLNPNYVAFMLGALTADILLLDGEDSTPFSRFYIRAINSKLGIVIITVLGILPFCCPRTIDPNSAWAVFSCVSTNVYRALGVAMLLHGLLRAPSVQGFFEKKLFLGIGEMSFAIYGFHWPIMLVVTMRLFALLLKPLGYDGAALLSFGLTLPFIFAVSYGAHLLLEKNRDYSVKGILRLFKRLRG